MSYVETAVRHSRECGIQTDISRFRQQAQLFNAQDTNNTNTNQA